MKQRSRFVPRVRSSQRGVALSLKGPRQTSATPADVLKYPPNPLCSASPNDVFSADSEAAIDGMLESIEVLAAEINVVASAIESPT